MSNIDNLIKERLNKLRSEAHVSSVQPSPSLPPPNKKSSVEEVEFLLQRLSAQTELEEKTMNEKLDIDSQIRQRLDKLKAESSGLVSSGRMNTGASSSLLLEPMEDVSPPPKSIEELHSADSDDPDTCVMCDLAPSLVCTDCFNDQYCQRCFTECHDPGENHQTKSYTAKK